MSNDLNQRDAMIRRYEDGDTWHSDDEVVEFAPPHKRPVDKVIPVRIHARDYDALRQFASARGIGLSTLLRELATQKLNEQHAISDDLDAMTAGRQYARLQLNECGAAEWVDLVERHLPSPAAEQTQEGNPRRPDVAPHTAAYHAIVRNADNRVLFTVEYVNHDAKDTREKDLPLRRDVARRLRTGAWKQGMRYTVAPSREVDA